MTPPYTFMNRPAAKALYFALTHDPFYITLEKSSSPDQETAREAMFRYLDFSLQEAWNHGRLTLPQDPSLGAAIWSMPQPRQTQAILSGQKKEFIGTHMGQDSLDAYINIVDFMSGQSGDVVPGDAWYLSIIGILPRHQGKGMGKALMLPVLKETDDLNLPVYAESFTPENFEFYTGLGFKKTKTIDEPFTESSYTILVRPPHPSGGKTK